MWVAACNQINDSLIRFSSQCQINSAKQILLLVKSETGLQYFIFIKNSKYKNNFDILDDIAQIAKEKKNLIHVNKSVYFITTSEFSRTKL